MFGIRCFKNFYGECESSLRKMFGIGDKIPIYRYNFKKGICVGKDYVPFSGIPESSVREQVVSLPFGLCYVPKRWRRIVRNWKNVPEDLEGVSEGEGDVPYENGQGGI